MELISALACGVRGAESGSAVLLNRGTVTPAPWYEDAEGSGIVDDGVAIPLDANGGAEVYVDRYVDVYVYDSDGAEVRRFTQMSNANSMEYRGPSFTGVPYGGGAAAANQPVSADTILDLWLPTNGGKDWKVDLGDGEVSIPVALGPARSIWCNVKDPAYGAVGDNTADDTAAFQAAIDACSDAGGGIVYIPPGTYMITSELTRKANVSLLGAGINATTLTMNHASNRLMSDVAASDEWDFVRGIRFTASVSNTAALYHVAGAARLVVDGCYFDGANSTGNYLMTDFAAAQRVVVRNCVFDITTSTQTAIDSSSTATGKRWRLEGCTFVPPATFNSTSGFIYGRHIDTVGCRFLNSLATAGTFSCFKTPTATLDATIIGCHFENSGGATITLMELGTYDNASHFVEDNNRIPLQSDGNTTAYSMTVTTAHTAGVVALRTRMKRVYYVATDSNETLPTDQYGNIFVNKTGVAAASYSTQLAPLGSELNLFLVNTNGSATGNQAVAIGGVPVHTLTGIFYSAWHAVFAAPSGKWLANGEIQNRTVA